MNVEMNALIEAIKTDYAGATSNTDVGHAMAKRFNEELSFKVGKKYVKVLTGGSVWGFIVNVDDDVKFQKGDILKAAGWATPARNSARGNILDGGYTVQWTGPLYLN